MDGKVDVIRMLDDGHEVKFGNSSVSKDDNLYVVEERLNKPVSLDNLFSVHSSHKDAMQAIRTAILLNEVTPENKHMKVGDKFIFTDEAIANYGEEFKGKTFTVEHVATSKKEHIGYDKSAKGMALYDAEELQFSLYEYEVIRL